MSIDRNAPATLGHLEDLKTELIERMDSMETRLLGLDGRLVDMEERLTERITESVTRSLSMEIGRVANVIMEHTASLIRAAGDHPKAIEEKLDAHIANASVHRRPARARRS